jgi:gluconolactonase
MRLFLWGWVFCLFGGLVAQAAESALLATGAKPQLLSREFEFTEGPAADAEGNVYFTDQPNDRIMKWGTDGKIATFLQPSGRSNGLYFDPSGHLLACADEKNELWSIGPDKKSAVIFKDYAGKRLNGPNDLWVRPDGALYFSDPYYQRSWWEHKSMPQEGQHVYFLSADRKTCKRVTDDLRQPNGLIGTPDGKTLYVADIQANKTYAYDIQSDGSLSNKRLFCELGSDGMTIDEQGNVYLTGRGVSVFDKTGKKIEQIEIPEPWTANVCFGGKEGKTLFVTASKTLYTVQMQVKGTGSVWASEKMEKK